MVVVAHQKQAAVNHNHNNNNNAICPLLYAVVAASAVMPVMAMAACGVPIRHEVVCDPPTAATVAIIIVAAATAVCNSPIPTASTNIIMLAKVG